MIDSSSSVFIAEVCELFLTQYFWSF